MNLADDELELLNWVGQHCDLNGLKQNGKHPQDLLAIILLGGDGSPSSIQKRQLFEDAIQRRYELYKEERKLRSSGSQDTTNKKRARKYKSIIQLNRDIAIVFAKLIDTGRAKPTGHCEPLIKTLETYNLARSNGWPVPILDEEAILILCKYASDFPRLHGHEYLAHLMKIRGTEH